MTAGGPVLIAVEGLTVDYRRNGRWFNVLSYVTTGSMIVLAVALLVFTVVPVS